MDLAGVHIERQAANTKYVEFYVVNDFRRFQSKGSNLQAVEDSTIR